MVATRSKLLLLGSVLLLFVALVGVQLLSNNPGVEVAKISVGGPLSHELGEEVAKVSVGGPLSYGIAKVSVGGPLSIGVAGSMNI